MIKIKICGLSRPCDIDFINEAKPDYCGFVIDFPKSRRHVTSGQVRELSRRLRDGIVPVGVFVNAPLETVSSLLSEGVISAAQLHGTEDENYLEKLRSVTSAPIIKAISVTGPGSMMEANVSRADYVLLDQGAGGTGKTFDWSLLRGLRRPYVLAGGLSPGNLPQALRAALEAEEAALKAAPETELRIAPEIALKAAPDASPLLHCVDLSSGVETEGYKDREKILAAVAAVRRFKR